MSEEALNQHLPDYESMQFNNATGRNRSSAGETVSTDLLMLPTFSSSAASRWCCFQNALRPRKHEFGVFLLTIMNVPVICGALMWFDYAGYRKAISHFMLGIFISAGVINILGNIVPFMMMKKEARPVILEFLFNISLCELLNSIYYVVSIVLGPEDTTSLYMSLIQASSLPQQYFVLDLYLPAVSSCFSVWMSYHFSKAAAVMRNDRLYADNFEVRWISPWQVFRMWMLPIPFFGLLFLLKTQIPQILGVMFGFRMICTIYMAYALYTLNDVDTRNVWIRQTRLYIIISIAWQFIYCIDDGIPEPLIHSPMVQNFLFGYLPISAAFARIFMNGTVFLLSNRQVIRRVWQALYECERITNERAEEDSENEYSAVADGTPVQVRQKRLDENVNH